MRDEGCITGDPVTPLQHKILQIINQLTADRPFRRWINTDQIAKNLGVPRRQISPEVKELEYAGFVTRYAMARSRDYQLTKKGRRYASR